MKWISWYTRTINYFFNKYYIIYLTRNSLSIHTHTQKKPVVYLSTEILDHLWQILPYFHQIIDDRYQQAPKPEAPKWLHKFSNRHFVYMKFPLLLRIIVGGISSKTPSKTRFFLQGVVSYFYTGMVVLRSWFPGHN